MKGVAIGALAATITTFPFFENTGDHVAMTVPAVDAFRVVVERNHLTESGYPAEYPSPIEYANVSGTASASADWETFNFVDFRSGMLE